ncbi:hypothetical protein SCOCK_70227 [Actinacidiphila cocklensis]|uniref:Uncharacterized protein n=1 Tax=Actinacidiphila cocklensis TaxID=887465 RepID=A0A9W4DXZ7_9ACTN|nr:hypothetical protein SCOCK_70227 [Actinacidiphila cocklensis]
MSAICASVIGGVPDEDRRRKTIAGNGLGYPAYHPRHVPLPRQNFGANPTFRPGGDFRVSSLSATPRIRTSGGCRPAFFRR